MGAAGSLGFAKLHLAWSGHKTLVCVVSVLWDMRDKQNSLYCTSFSPAHLTTSFLMVLSFLMKKLACSSLFSLFWMSSSCCFFSEARLANSSDTFEHTSVIWHLLSAISFPYLFLKVINCHQLAFAAVLCSHFILSTTSIHSLINWTIFLILSRFPHLPEVIDLCLIKSASLAKLLSRLQINPAYFLTNHRQLTLNSSMLIWMIFSVWSSSRPRARARCWSLQRSEIIWLSDNYREYLWRLPSSLTSGLELK